MSEWLQSRVKYAWLRPLKPHLRQPSFSLGHPFFHQSLAVIAHFRLTASHHGTIYQRAAAFQPLGRRSRLAPKVQPGGAEPERGL